MAVLPIRISGDPVLHTPAQAVGDIDQELRMLVSDMFETMDAAPGVGLAAPQVGVPLRLFTYGWTDESGTPWRGVAINPELWVAPIPPREADEVEDSEGCLSFPGERFPLVRAERAMLRARNLAGESVEITAQGWLARIFQHEFDHLDGILYIDRIDEANRKTAGKIARKAGWGAPGASWLPGRDFLEG
jgi:peptide deformylase